MKFKKRYIFFGLIIIFILVLIINSIIVNNENAKRMNKEASEYILVDDKISKIESKEKLDIVKYSEAKKTIFGNMISMFQLMGCGNYKPEAKKDTTFNETKYDQVGISLSKSLVYDDNYIYNLYKNKLIIYDILNEQLVVSKTENNSDIILYNDLIICLSYYENNKVNIYKLENNELKIVKSLEIYNIINAKLKDNQLVLINKTSLDSFNDYTNTYYNGSINASFAYTINIIDLDTLNIKTVNDINSLVSTKITDSYIYIASNNLYTNVSTYIDIYDYNLNVKALRINGKIINSEAITEDDNKLKVITIDYTKEENYQILNCYNLKTFDNKISKEIVFDTPKITINSLKFEGSLMYAYTSKLTKDNPVFIVDTTNIENIKVSNALSLNNYYIYKYKFSLNNQAYYYKLIYDTNHLKGEIYNDKDELVTSMYYMDLDYIKDVTTNKYIINRLFTPGITNLKNINFNIIDNKLYMTLKTTTFTVSTFVFDSNNLSLLKETNNENITSYSGLFINNKQYVVINDEISIS